MRHWQDGALHIKCWILTDEHKTYSDEKAVEGIGRGQGWLSKLAYGRLETEGLQDAE
jgi:hypothetical protein